MTSATHPPRLQVDDVLERLLGVYKNGNDWRACCPAHDDRNPSMSVSVGDKGILLHCHAGCDVKDIARAMGIEVAQLFKDGGSNGAARRKSKTWSTTTGFADWLAKKTGGRRAGVWIYRHADGSSAMATIRIDKPDGEKDIKPMRSVAGGWEVGDPPGKLPLYNLPALAAAETVVVVEGEKCADAARELDMVATTSAHGAKSPHKSDWTPLAGKAVVILPDADEPGRKYANKVAGILTKLSPPARVKVVELPGLGEGGDIVDYIELRDSVTSEDIGRGIREMADAAPDWTPAPGEPKRERKTRKAAADDDDRVPVTIGVNDEARSADEAIAALATDRTLFQRAGLLVSFNEATRLAKPLTVPAIRDRITRVAALEKENGEPTEMPRWLAPAVASRGEYPGVRELDAVATAPVLRPDGTVVCVPGYDAATRTLYLPDAAYPPLPEKLTQEDAQRAAAALSLATYDFPFVAHEDGAAWLAALATAVGRSTFNGPSPAFAITANAPGVGKSLAAQLIGVIAQGRPIAVSGYSTNDDEMRKRITAIAAEGDRLILWDNLTDSFGGSSVDRALTCDLWIDRTLGFSSQIRAPLLATWIVTSNNFTTKADTSRRTVLCRLESLDDKPEERTGFQHADLLTWARAERPRLYMAALTIVAAYVRCGRPSRGLSPFGGFEGWNATIRAALEWATGYDPLATRKWLAESDTGRDALDSLLTAWAAYVGIDTPIVVATLLRDLYPDAKDAAKFTKPGEADMRTAVEAFCNAPSGKVPTAKAFGNRLNKIARRPLSGRYFERGEKTKAGRAWTLRTKATVTL